MTALAMHNIPLSSFDDGIHLRRDVVISLRWPGLNAEDVHSLDFLFSGKRKMMRHSCQKRNINPVTHKTTPDFVDMRFDPPYVGEVARRYHQYIQWFCPSGHCLIMRLATWPSYPY